MSSIPEDELRAMVRESIARALSRQDAAAPAAPVTSAFPPPWQAPVQLLRLGLVDSASAVVDALGVQPHAQRAFVGIVRLLVPRPLTAGSPDSLELLQPMLPTRLILGLAG